MYLQAILKQCQSFCVTPSNIKLFLCLDTHKKNGTELNMNGTSCYKIQVRVGQIMLA